MILNHLIVCCVICIPPGSSSSYHDTLVNFLTSVSLNSSDCDTAHLLLPGDFNFTEIDWSTFSGQSYVSQQFLRPNFDIGLDQLINLQTHNKGNILDLLLTNMDDSIDSVKVHSINRLLPSDHYGITFNLLFSKPPTKKTTYYSYNYSKGHYQGLYDYLSHINLSSCFLCNDVESIWEEIELVI